MLDMLERIRAGQKTFTPQTEGASQDEFEFIAYQLFQAEEDGLIIINGVSQERTDGHHHFTAVFVEGLTAIGAELLNSG